MKTSNQGIELIASFESFKPQAYYDAGGLYSIGYGTLIDSTEESYLRHATITEKEAKNLLYRDAKKIEDAINSRISSLNQNEFDALVSFGYNLGSAPVIKMVERLNSGWSKTQVADKMLLYTKSGGVELAGLVKRRKAEVELFLTKPKLTKQIINTASLVPGGLATSVTILLTITLIVGYKLFNLQR